jgi:hypothetical protein
MADGMVWYLEGSNVEHLHQRIIEVSNAVTPDIIERVFVDWVKQLNLCVESNGGHIEQVL